MKAFKFSWKSLLKFIFLGFALWLLFQKIDFEQISSIKIKTGTKALALGILAFIIIWFVNFSLDAFTWLWVQSIIRPIKFLEAVNHNLKSYALAFITPLNSGELAGRYLVQKGKEHQQKAVFLTFWIHIPKLFSKSLVALPLIILLFSNNLQSYYKVLSFLVMLVLLVLYFNLQKLISALNSLQIKGLAFSNYLIKGRPRQSEKLKLLLANIIRFLCFSSQLAIVIWVLNPEELNLLVLLSIPLFYYLTAIVPTWSAFDFLIKGAISLYFFEHFTKHEELFLVASTIVWFFNKATPSIIGLVQFNPEELKKLSKA